MTGADVPLKIVHGFSPGTQMNPPTDEEVYDPRWQRDQVQHFVRAAVEAEELGYDGISVTEHHSPSMISSSPHLLLAAAAIETKYVTLHSAVTVLPLYNPVRVAEEAGLLDQLSNGRFHLGVGRGTHEVQVASGNAIGIEEHNERYVEGLVLLEKALNETDFKFDGRQFRVPDPLTISSKPVQENFPVWVGSGSLSSVEQAASRGWGVMRNLGSVESHKQAFEHLVEVGARHGHVLGGDKMWIERFIAIGSTPEQANANMMSAAAKLARFISIFTAAGRFELDAEVIPDMEHGVDAGGTRPVLASLGTPEMLIEELTDLLDATGARYLQILTFSDDEMRLFAHEVVPQLRKHFS